MEEDFVKVADLIHEAIQITAFICSTLDGGAKAPLKVGLVKLFLMPVGKVFDIPEYVLTY